MEEKIVSDDPLGTTKHSPKDSNHRSMRPLDPAHRFRRLRQEKWMREHAADIDLVVNKVSRVLNSCSVPGNEMYIDFTKLEHNLSKYLYKTS